MTGAQLLRRGEVVLANAADRAHPVCQIDCEDIAPFDPEGRLPHEGMFYVFAGLQFPRGGMLNILWKGTDFEKKKWKLTQGYLSA